MDLDRNLFEQVRKKQHPPYLRFYGWEKPTVSFGRTHDLENEPLDRLASEGWSAVRRPTGGGTVLHRNDLCFSIAWTQEGGCIPWGIAESYLAIHKFAKAALEKIGIPSQFHKESEKPAYYGNRLCFKNPVCSDLMIDGRKVTGGAQWRSHGAALHQGSIQLDIGPERVEDFKRTFESHFGIRFLLPAELSRC